MNDANINVFIFQYASNSLEYKKKLDYMYFWVV